MTRLHQEKHFTNYNWSLYFLIMLFSVFLLIAIDAAQIMWQPSRNLGLFLWTFIASTISSIVGFAYSPIAGSILFHVVPDHVEAVSILLISSISLQSYAVYCLRKMFRWKAFWPFLLGGLLGLAPGFFILLNTDSAWLTFLVGAISATYGAHAASGAQLKLTYKGKLGDICAGFLGGLIGPVAAFPGAFVTIWCSAKGGDKSAQRAVYQPFIFVMQLSCLALLVCIFPGKHIISLEHLLFAIPAILGASVGLAIFRRLTGSQFQRLLGVFLIIAGASLLSKALGVELVLSSPLLSLWT
jgi:uncharacterized membrane protein YfcA